MRLIMALFMVVVFALDAYSLKVDYIRCGLGVKDKRVVKVSEDFKVGDKVYCLSSISDIGKETFIIHRWVSDEGYYDVKLQIKPFERFRTWSYHTVRSPGVWKLEVLDPDGKMLSEKIFVVREK